ncbi:MAG: hypothetical protein A3H27_02980 [Acidobacteria bacterium RIFCSPLOWO2_02_FULL_59_13]|nr:MAG: hypothetical protein A3H27_02980 [Acidobacteria bacterium RIFCSPLOWO2_02_FULL_59_13]
MLKLTEPLALRSGESVRLIVVRRADPSRWDINRLAKCANEEDLTLAEQGIEGWAAKLEEEDRR